MVVAGGEGLQVVKTVEGDGVVGSVEANGGGVTGDVTLSDVVCGLSTDEETITSEDGVSGEGRALSR